MSIPGRRFSINSNSENLVQNMTGTAAKGQAQTRKMGGLNTLANWEKLRIPYNK